MEVLAVLIMDAWRGRVCFRSYHSFKNLQIHCSPRLFFLNLICFWFGFVVLNWFFCLFVCLFWVGFFFFLGGGVFFFFFLVLLLTLLICLFVVFFAERGGGGGCLSFFLSVLSVRLCFFFLYLWLLRFWRWW